MIINTDCYLAVLKKYRTKWFDAHFEVITRTSKSCLSPSKELLNYAKENKISFEEYKEKFLKELKERPFVSEKLRTLKRIGEDRLIFLVCYEKDASKCHRSIIKDILMTPSKYGYDLSWKN